MNDVKHLTPRELARRWGMNPGTLANQRSARTGCTYLRLGGRVAYRAADVLAYEAACVVSPGGAA